MIDDARLRGQTEMFVNRLVRNARHRRKWAAREGIGCYRLYDRDIPEVPLVVDWYEGRLHVAELYRDDELDSHGDFSRAEALARAGADALGVERDRVFLKSRRRQQGAAQYERLGTEGAKFMVSEGGLRFLVCLTDYLDSGLFLDHRITRALVGRDAAGAHVLNLFAYTGAFSVYAGVAGAATTTSVDLSNTYLDWAAENLALNDLRPPSHRVERADALELLRRGDLGGAPYDLIILDPPTFSNSAKMVGTLDVQRDHRWMVERAGKLLSPRGVLWFSTNARRFRPELDELPGLRAVEMTSRTVPPDFAQHRPHRSWRIAKV